jgi:hypothetical protein
MKKPAKQNYLLGASCLLAAVLQVWFSLPLDGSEFSGGRLTGPILNSSDYGGYLFLATAVLALFLLRASSTMAIASGFLCLPLYLYAIAPEIFRRAFPGDYKDPLVSTFMWSPLAVAGICSVALAIFIAVYSFKEKK